MTDQIASRPTNAWMQISKSEKKKSCPPPPQILATPLLLILWHYIIWKQSKRPVSGHIYSIMKKCRSHYHYLLHLLLYLLQFTFIEKKMKKEKIKIAAYLDGRKVGHFLITIQKSFKLIINQS